MFSGIGGKQVPFISTAFTKAGAPETGLSPTVDVIRLTDSVIVAVAKVMTHAGLGLYKFDFNAGEGFVVGVEYAFRVDGGVTLSDPDRYKFGPSLIVAAETAATTEVLQAGIHGSGSWEGMTDFTNVIQGWARGLTGGSKFIWEVGLTNNGNFVALPGASRLAIEVRDFSNTVIPELSRSDVAPDSDGNFRLTELSFPTPNPNSLDGQILAVKATVTLSGVGGGTHVGMHFVSLSEFLAAP